MISKCNKCGNEFITDNDEIIIRANGVTHYAVNICDHCASSIADIQLNKKMIRNKTKQ